MKNVYNKFKRIIGEYDATNEYIELILRDFGDRIATHENYNKFLLELSQKHNIKINEYKIQNVHSRIVKNYLVSVHLCFETFLKDINELGNKYTEDWRTKDKEDSWLKHICNNVLNRESQKKINDMILLCEYYRGIRNTTVHDLHMRRCDVTYSMLNPVKDSLKCRFPKLEAPKDIDTLGFDDFILFTRCAKEIGEVIFNNFSYDIEKIVELFDYKKFNSIKNSDKRLKSAVSEQIKMEYNLEGNQLEECVKNIINAYHKAC